MINSQDVPTGRVFFRLYVLDNKLHKAIVQAIYLSL